ncbi:MAG: hypothetical protein V1799_02465 [bacterium]
MTTIYSKKLLVSPFIVLPTAVTNEEAKMVLGPTWISEYSNDLINAIHNTIDRNGITCPLIAQSFTFRRKLLICNTIKSSVPDHYSKRIGLMFTYGAIIENETLLRFSDITRTIWLIYQDFFRSQFNTIANFEGIDKVVEIFQQRDSSTNDKFSSDIIIDFLNKFECAFSLLDKTKPHFANRVYFAFSPCRKLLRQRAKPCLTFQDADIFWLTFDRLVSTISPISEKSKRAFITDSSLQNYIYSIQLELDLLKQLNDLLLFITSHLDNSSPDTIRFNLEYITRILHINATILEKLFMSRNQ